MKKSILALAVFLILGFFAQYAWAQSVGYTIGDWAAAGHTCSSSAAANGDQVIAWRSSASCVATISIGTMSAQNADAVTITGGTINGTAIGGVTPGAGAFTTLSATGNLTTNVTGSTQCLHVNSSGVVSGTGSDCGSGGGGVSGPVSSTNKAIATWSGTGGNTLLDNSAVTITSGVITATGFSGPLTGNASTATALQNARTIGGTSFDGTSNITVSTATGGFTISGGDLALGANNLTMTGSIGTTGSRITKLWATDITVTNAISGSITGNAGTATALQNARMINGTSFDGTGNITITAAAGTLTGGTLNSGVTASSLTSVGTLTGGATGSGFTLALSTSTVTGTLASARMTNITVIRPRGPPYCSDTSGRYAPGYYAGAGGNVSAHEYGAQIKASLDADTTLEYRFDLPQNLPAGTLKLRLLALANATSGAAKLTIKDGVATPATSPGSSGNPSAASLTSETQSTVTWTTSENDRYKELKVTLTAAPAGGDVLVVAITFNTTSWTLAQVSTWIPMIIWE